LTKEFSHPLARAARVWNARNLDGSEQRILVIVTTMELDPAERHYKKKFVERLSNAAREHLAHSSDASAFVSEPDETMASVTTAADIRRPKVPKASEYVASEHASQSTIRRVNAPATMPSRNALESARKRNVPISSSQAGRYRLSGIQTLRTVSG
jgi:hypothetical protein